MPGKIFLICVVAFLCGCTSFNLNQRESLSPSSAIEENFWLTLPKPGSLIIIGAAGPQSKSEYVIDAAREDAARKVSMFYEVHATEVSVQSTGNSVFDYYADTDALVSYNKEVSAYLEGLTYNPEQDVKKVGNTTFIRFSYPASFPGTVNFQSAKNPDGSPDWITHPPAEIGGYLAGVGFGRKQSRISGTYAKSCEAAVISLVAGISSSVSAQEATTNDGTASVTYHESSGNLKNFLVLEVWMDPATDDVWTLAVAQKKN